MALLPLIVTLAVLGFIVGKILSWFGPSSAFGAAMRGLAERLGLPSASLVYAVSLLLTLALIVLIGHFARRYTGQRIGEWVTAMVSRVPFINKIYSSTDQVVALLTRRGGDASGALSHVVMARIGSVRVLGMLSSPEPVHIDGADYHIVFLPSTPIPASGQNILVPVEDVVDAGISVEEMTKILVSLGSLGPGILNKVDASNWVNRQSPDSPQ
ncbi:MAG: DUF502 domain-containing protein [bacterium]|nr:DUF502 domain-containing protein [bacterium]